MNQTKPHPEGPRPKKETRPHVSTVEHTCSGKTPCGGKCELNARYRHMFHSCANKDCTLCHADERFRRAA